MGRAADDEYPYCDRCQKVFINKNSKLYEYCPYCGKSFNIKIEIEKD